MTDETIPAPAGVRLEPGGRAVATVEVGVFGRRVRLTIDSYTDGVSAHQVARLSASDAREIATALRMAADRVDGPAEPWESRRSVA